MRVLFPFWILSASLAFAQRPPVILIDGYHLLCQNEDLSSAHDFGALQSKLESQGVKVVFLGTCLQGGKPSIEAMGSALGTAIQNLKAPEVDLVSHSMGGLIVRSYLSGKQTASGKFTPPADPRVRKWVSIATPNFGALIPSALFDFLPDVQARELAPGSQFLFDLATWIQNHDDLRGVDAVGIIGNAGGFGPFESASDGTVSMTSASLSFAVADERTRILPYCHGAGTLTALLGLGCDAPPLARIQSDNPLSWQIIDSFLSGTDAWRSVGHSPSQDRYLSQYGGTLSQARDNLDRPAGSIEDRNFVTRPPLVGSYSVVIQKAGPQIAAVYPSAARLDGLSLAPRMLISIYGSNLSGSTVTVNDQLLALNYVGDQQINAVLPASIAGLATLTVSNERGKQSVNILLADAMPAVFTADGSGKGVAAAIRSGDVLSLYLTGLGLGAVPYVVTLDGLPVSITYSGPAPGFPGLDQINVLLPPRTVSGTVVVIAGKRASNPVLVPPA